MKKMIIILLLAILFLLASCHKHTEEYILLNNSLVYFDQDYIDFMEKLDKDNEPFEQLNSVQTAYDDYIARLDSMTKNLESIKDKITQEEYDDAKKKIDDFYIKTQNIIDKGEKYAIKYVEKKVGSFLSDYEHAQDKSQTNTENVQEFVTYLNSHAEEEIFKDERMQSQIKILSAFIACRDAYADWIAAGAEYEKVFSSDEDGGLGAANSALLSAAKTSFDKHKEAFGLVLQLDDDTANLEEFKDIFFPHSEEYVHSIDYTKSLINE